MEQRLSIKSRIAPGQTLFYLYSSPRALQPHATPVFRPADVELLIIAATLLIHIARVQYVVMEPRYYTFGGWDGPGSD